MTCSKDVKAMHFWIVESLRIANCELRIALLLVMQTSTQPLGWKGDMGHEASTMTPAELQKGSLRINAAWNRLLIRKGFSFGSP